MNAVVEAIFFILAMLIFFGSVFGFFAYIRYLRYRETIELAEKGLLRPERRNRRGGISATLKWGYVSLFLGIALILGLWPLGVAIVDVRFPLGLGPWMLLGFIPFFFGVALLVIDREGKKEALQDRAEEDETIEPVPFHKQS